VATRILGLCKEDGTLEENPIKMRGMFSDQVQNIFSTYHMSKSVVATTRDACYRVVPQKDSIRDRDRL